MESEWREVRRKPSPQKIPPGVAGIRFDPAVTSFYVSSLLGDVKKGDLWKDCANLGNLVDIYIVGRRDSSGLFLAFVRYLDVEKPETNTDGLNNINVRGRKLKANCAKIPPSILTRPKAPPVRQVPRFHNAPRDSRSFRDVLGGKKINNRTKPDVHAPVVSLSAIPEIQEWAQSEIYVGTAMNFDTLCNFPALISLEGFV
ncbi:hypothetical protein LXL04_038978 [Taraxacum kok-saghyz]